MWDKQNELSVKELKRISESDSGLEQYEEFLAKVDERPQFSPAVLELHAENAKKYAHLLQE